MGRELLPLLVGGDYALELCRLYRRLGLDFDGGEYCEDLLVGGLMF